MSDKSNKRSIVRSTGNGIVEVDKVLPFRGTAVDIFTHLSLMEDAIQSLLKNPGDYLPGLSEEEISATLESAEDLVYGVAVVRLAVEQQRTEQATFHMAQVQRDFDRVNDTLIHHSLLKIQRSRETGGLNVTAYNAARSLKIVESAKRILTETPDIEMKLLYQTLAAEFHRGNRTIKDTLMKHDEVEPFLPARARKKGRPTNQ